MTQRLEFIRAVASRQLTMRAACRQFGVSEKTGYKWLRRFCDGGPNALADRSHAPHAAAHQVEPSVRALIGQLRDAHPTWGARKLRSVLAAKYPAMTWPAPSTITTLLHRSGQIPPTRRTARDRAAWATGLTEPQVPNDVWTADYKGEFRLQTGPYCYPLTIVDLASRFVVGLRAFPRISGEATQAEFIRCFERCGLPQVVRTDNGVPFGAPGALGGLSVFALWLIRLAIRPERIHKGVPQENGAHERMHRTLKAETTRPPASTLLAQQRRFDRWRHEFNTERPPEALGLTPPATQYTPSPRPYPRRLPLLEYPTHHEVRRVDYSGIFRWAGERVFLSKVLAGEYVGVELTGEAEWTVTLGSLRLGWYRSSDHAFVEALAWLPSAPSTTLDASLGKPRDDVRLSASHVSKSPATVSPIIPV